MSNSRPEIVKNVVGPLGTNCYLLFCPGSRETLIIDPGGDPLRIKKKISGLNLRPIEIICTHGHSDHIAAVADIKKEYGIGFAVHPDAVEIIKHSVEVAPMWGLGTIEMPEVDRTISHGDTISTGEIRGEVRHTPGHSPGGITLVFDGMALVGDSLFAGSIGRTDLFGGNFKQLIDSIKTRIITLPGETRLYCGHGPETTVAAEESDNPYLNM
ncbi:MAG: MBL fold metallo-hydrolase [Candidatus Krumholzibacteriales bacterium]